MLEVCSAQTENVGNKQKTMNSLKSLFLQQFLQMLSGDEEEHAIMLVNFFLHMGKKAWLICGTAIPEGPTAYVLSEEDADAGYWIWNPSSGDHFRVQDMTCPLQSIGCLVNHENVSTYCDNVYK